MYRHITPKERAEIAYLLARRKSFAHIAREIGVHRATIAREYHRNKDDDGTYRAHRAHKKAKARHRGKQDKHKRVENNTALERYVTRSLTYYWSPEQIAGRLQRDGTMPYVSHTTIYAYIHRSRPDLKKYRRHKRHRRLSQISPKQATKRMIATRPEIGAYVGDWEGDTIIGRERIERMLTHVDKKSGLLKAHRTQADSHTVRLATQSALRDVPCRSITYDNGSEFAAFERTEAVLGVPIYFAEPGKPHQRGTNENTNGLLRQFFPKGTLFANITQRELDVVVSLINNRPRKRLGYRTPQEVFDSEVALMHLRV